MMDKECNGTLTSQDETKTGILRNHFCLLPKPLGNIYICLYQSEQAGFTGNEKSFLLVAVEMYMLYTYMMYMYMLSVFQFPLR